ncbi:hypothetical protein BZA77DRAFT_352213 [Pyronema omphalodes]|nr:hypothetical protein BZA77DRAFT_352213 [Pyronema omphalodes]
MRRKSDKAQANWSEDMVSSLVEVVLDEFRLCRRVDTGFKSTSFERALPEIHQKVYRKGLPPKLDFGQVKSKLYTDLLITIKGYSPVPWDNAKAMVLAEPSVWDRILLTCATGEFAMTPSQLARPSSPPWPDDLHDEDTSATSSPKMPSDNNTQSSQPSEFPLTQSPGVGFRPCFLIQATQRHKRRNSNHEQVDDIESPEDFPQAK